MKLGRSSRVVLLLLAGLMVGYFIGPPIVHAATSLVTIQGGGSTHKARVDSKGRLSVNTEAATLADGSMLTTSFTAPLGELLIFSQAGGGGGLLWGDSA